MRFPGVSAQLNLKKGASDSETQGVVQVEPDKPVDVSISADNSGPRSTGRGRVIGGLTLNNPTRRGDQFSAQLMASEGLKYFAMSYSLPVTNQAWRLGLRMSSMNYSLVANEYAGLDAKGPTQSAGVFLQIPWLKTPRDSDVLTQTSLPTATSTNSMQRHIRVIPLICFPWGGWQTQ
jgi:hemolysin activation/secretion protein